METLVLTVDYKPHARISWKKAIKLILKGRVEVLDEYDGWFITATIKVPSIVRLIRSIFRTDKNVKFSRENIWLRDRGKCQYCDALVAKNKFTYDHVLPRAKGGKTTWENIVVSCMPCNQRKGNRALKDTDMHLKTPPFRPKKLTRTFTVSFHWNENMPNSWKQFLDDLNYWHGELEE